MPENIGALRLHSACSTACVSPVSHVIFNILGRGGAIEVASLVVASYVLKAVGCRISSVHCRCGARFEKMYENMCFIENLIAAMQKDAGDSRSPNISI